MASTLEGCPTYLHRCAVCGVSMRFDFGVCSSHVGALAEIPDDETLDAAAFQFEARADAAEFENARRLFKSTLGGGEQ